MSDVGRADRKRLGDEAFMPVTLLVEPSELATIESIAKYSGRSRSDVMREMLSYGLAHVMKEAFGGGDGSGSSARSAEGASASESRSVVGAYLPDYDIAVLEALNDIGGVSRSELLRSRCRACARRVGER